MAIGCAGVMISLIISTGTTSRSTGLRISDCTAQSAAAWKNTTTPAMAILRASVDGSDGGERGGVVDIDWQSGIAAEAQSGWK